jgi:hypothetical protein
MQSTVTPADAIISHKIYIYILSTTTMFSFVIPPSVSPIVICIMYHLVTTPESFDVIVDYTITGNTW